MKKYKIREGSVVKENKTGGFYTWHDREEILIIVDAGRATLASEKYNGELSISTDLDNLIEVENDSTTVSE